jgi:hypothetical protein
MTAIEEQILDCFPSGSYALSALLRLMDIVESEEVPTASVECRNSITFCSDTRHCSKR